jgi:hypothetical protein
MLLTQFNNITKLFNNEDKPDETGPQTPTTAPPVLWRSPAPSPQVVLETAERAGLLRGENGRIAGRVRAELIRLAKERSGLTSDTQLLEYALAKVALEDDFGPKILARKGRVSTDIDLEC